MARRNRHSSHALTRSKTQPPCSPLNTFRVRSMVGVQCDQENTTAFTSVTLLHHSCLDTPHLSSYCFSTIQIREEERSRAAQKLIHLKSHATHVNPLHSLQLPPPPHCLVFALHPSIFRSASRSTTTLLRCHHQFHQFPSFIISMSPTYLRTLASTRSATFLTIPVPTPTSSLLIQFTRVTPVIPLQLFNSKTFNLHLSSSHNLLVSAKQSAFGTSTRLCNLLVD